MVASSRFVYDCCRSNTETSRKDRSDCTTTPNKSTGTIQLIHEKDLRETIELDARDRGMLAWLAVLAMPPVPMPGASRDVSPLNSLGPVSLPSGGAFPALNPSLPLFLD